MIVWFIMNDKKSLKSSASSKAMKIERKYRDYDRIQKLKKNAFMISKSIVLNQSVNDLWGHLANMNMVDKMAGIPPTTKTFFVNNSYGGTTVNIFSWLFGYYIELPFEWINLKFYRTEWVFRFGIPKYACIETYFTEKGKDKTEVRIDWYLNVPKIFHPMFKLYVKITLKKIFSWYKNIDKYLSFPDEKLSNYNQFMGKKVSKSESDIKSLTGKLEHVIKNEPISKTLSEIVFTSPDEYLKQMRPFQIAKTFNYDKDELLKSMLESTVKGYFDMHWDILCPRCRMPKSRKSRLGDIGSSVHCNTCNIKYDARYSSHVELTFTPNPSVRKISDSIYCYFTPTNTPHFFSQFNVAPNKNRKVNVSLKEGDYLVRYHTQKEKTIIRIDKNSQNKTFQLALDANKKEESNKIILAPDFEFEVSNPNDHWETVTFENLGYQREMATADIISTMHEYRDLFSDDALRLDTHLSVKSVTVMFADMCDSTKIYEILGDAKALSVIQDFFKIIINEINKHNGSVIKTVGDEVMAVFIKPVDALKASFEINRHLKEFHLESKGPVESISLRIGMNKGPALMLGVNNITDYFGKTVNAASRILHKSDENEILISESIHMDNEVKDLLSKTEREITQNEYALKGIDHPTVVYTIQAIDS